MEYKSDFEYDLKIGQLAEQKLGNAFENKTIEVKRDLKANETGNLFIEFESRGKPSGIDKSKADYWCFALKTVFILISSENLKALVEPLKGTDREKRGGDNNTSVGVLLKITDLLQHSK